MSRRFQSTAASPSAVNGREYFRSKERELRIENLDPASVQESENLGGLKRGIRKSRVGGRIATDLKHLSSEETAARQQRSESFLSQPPKYFPADDAAQGASQDDKNTD
jgi:hypothetical protein